MSSFSLGQWEEVNQNYTHLPHVIVLFWFFFFALSDTWSEKKWGPNVTEFQQRFDEVITRGEGPRRLKNLYFLYLIELRALSKVRPFFERPGFQLYTGNKSHDAEVKNLLLEILHLAK